MHELTIINDVHRNSPSDDPHTHILDNTRNPDTERRCILHNIVVDNGYIYALLIRASLKRER